VEKIRLEELSNQIKVNDIHVHLGYSEGINNSLPIEKLNEYIKKNNIDEIVLMPFEKDTDIYNQKIINLSKENKSIHGFFWIQKHRIKDDLAILKKDLNDGLIGVKFHGSYENLPVNSDIYEPIMEFLNDKESLLLIHCGRFKDGDPSSATSFIHGLKIAQKFPKIKVILAHMGGNDTAIVKRAVNAALEFKNIFFDISGTSTPFRIEYAVKTLGPNRILFGSDYPWCSFNAMYYNVKDSLLDDKIKEMIFHENFVNLIHD